MRTLFLSLLFLCAWQGTTAQQTVSPDRTGTWQAVLMPAPSVKIRLVLHLSQENGTYQAKMDSPDQGAFGIEVAEVAVRNDSLMIGVPAIMMRYSGKFVTADSLNGTFTQGTYSTPLPFVREQRKKAASSLYDDEEVLIPHLTEQTELHGTLSLPKGEGKFPAVFFMSGTGTQDRDNSLFGNQSFRVIADALAKEGIVPLRCDDKEIYEKRTDGGFASISENVQDAASQLRFLRQHPKVDSRRIGIIGHSQGGAVAFRLAAEAPESVAFVVAMAGLMVDGEDLYWYQAEKMYHPSERIPKELQDAMLALIKNTELTQQERKDACRKILTEAAKYKKNNEEIDELEKHKIEIGVVLMSSPASLELYRYAPATDLGRVRCPVLAVFGGKDVQVPEEQSVRSLRALLPKKTQKKLEIKTYPELNHLFLPCETGLPSEYMKLKGDIDNAVLQDIVAWIKAQ